MTPTSSQPAPAVIGGRWRRFLREVVHVAPHRGDHRIAARAGLSVLVPLLALVLLGRPEWTPYAAFGAFTALYGRHHGRAERAGMQAVAGLALVVSVTLGVGLSLLPESRWLVVGVGALLAVWGSVTSDAYRWHPPGPIFLLFGLAVCAMLPNRPVDLLVAPLVAAGSAAFSLVVGHVGVLREPGSWSRPTLPSPSFGEALARPGARAHLVRYVLALTIAGSTGTALGWSHPYWAMVACCAVLSGPDRSFRLRRGMQRILGTLLGVGVAALLLPWAPAGAGAVLVIVVLQAMGELFVGRNYAIGLLFITPLALMMGQLVHPSPVGPLLRDRAVETVLGAAVAMALLLLVPDRLGRTRPVVR